MASGGRMEIEQLIWDGFAFEENVVAANVGEGGGGREGRDQKHESNGGHASANLPQPCR